MNTMSSMKEHTPLWKISLAVWLPIVVLLIVAYTVTYVIKYQEARNNVKVFEAKIAQCNAEYESAAEYYDFNKQAKNWDPSDVFTTPKAMPLSQIQKYDNCINAKAGINHGFLLLPKAYTTQIQ